ncbi:MAG: ATP-binding protein [Bacteroidota bacterium]
MQALPTEERRRLEALEYYGGLEGPPDRTLDRVTALAARVYDVPITFVSLLDHETQVFRSCHGVSIDRTAREGSFCDHTIRQSDVLIVTDASTDERFSAHPFVAGPPHLKFYAGVPLKSPDGVNFGTLCLMDVQSRTLDDEQCRTLVELAEIVVDELNLRREFGAREAAEAELRAREQRFGALLRHSSDLILVLDEEGMLVYASPSSEAIIGQQPVELLNTSAFSYIHDEDVVGVVEAFSRAGTEAGRIVLGTFRWRHRDGQWRYLEAIGTNLLHEASVSGLVVNARDVTQSRRYAEERAARERAEELLRLKMALLDNMSHELRTPLVGMLGFLELLEDEVDQEQQQLVQPLLASTRRMQSTVSSMLDLAHLEGGLRKMNTEIIDVAPHVEEIASDYREQARRKGIELTVEASPGLDAAADCAALRRVLDHLINNAVKFTDIGGVYVTARLSPKGVRIDINDTGVGISPDFLPELFDAFKQESLGHARTHEGSGLGLTLTNRLISLMGGRLQVESTKGQGSTFSVWLPCKPVAQPVMAGRG